jgi:hypothetical protein
MVAPPVPTSSNHATAFPGDLLVLVGWTLGPARIALRRRWGIGASRRLAFQLAGIAAGGCRWSTVDLGSAAAAAPPQVATRASSDCRRGRHGPQVRRRRGRAVESTARSAPSKGPSALTTAEPGPTGRGCGACQPSSTRRRRVHTPTTASRRGLRRWPRVSGRRRAPPAPGPPRVPGRSGRSGWRGRPGGAGRAAGGRWCGGGCAGRAG